MRRDYVSGGRQARSRGDDPVGAGSRLSPGNDALSRCAQHAALKLIVERHAGAADYRALRRVLELCRRATAAIDDRYCRDKLRLVEDFAAEMLSRGEQRAQFLQRQILNALELLHSRLYSLEALRRAPGRSGLKAVELLRT